MMHSFLLIGQSNMAGRGFLHEAPEINTEGLHVLRNGRWQPMYRPVNGDRFFSGSCLAESFAEKYAKTYGVEVGLICCADGGTRLDQWVPGGLLYDNAVNNARLADRTSTIAGVLWHQGEGDCTKELAPLYQEKFERIMASFRKDLNLFDVPFLLGGLGDFLKDNESENLRTFYPAVNEAIKRTAEENPMTGFVSAEGLGANPDNLHFSAKALYDFGLRYFDVFETLRNPHKVFTEKSAPDDAVRTEMELL